MRNFRLDETAKTTTLLAPRHKTATAHSARRARSRFTTSPFTAQIDRSRHACDREAIELAAKGGHPARSIRLYVSFGLHTFTRAWQPGDLRESLYGDDREVRTFCVERHLCSFDLLPIFHSIENRHCEFARGSRRSINYVVVETSQNCRYAAFFDLRRLRMPGADAVHLLVQSAYVLDRNKPPPGKDGYISMRCWVTHSEEPLLARLPELPLQRARKAKPRSRRGFT